jgi:hypothetical protein
VRLRGSCLKSPKTLSGKTPTSLVYDTPIQILYLQCRIQVKFHIRHTSNPAYINFCTYHKSEMDNFINQTNNCKPQPYIYTWTRADFQQTLTSTQDLPVEKWLLSEIPENAIMRRKCAPTFTLVFNDGQKFPIPHLNNTWIQLIIQSQGPEFRYAQRDCKTQGCIIVKNPSVRHRRDLTVITNDDHYAGHDVHCGEAEGVRLPEGSPQQEGVDSQESRDTFNQLLFFSEHIVQERY